MPGAHRARHAYRPEHLLRPQGRWLGVPSRLGRRSYGQPAAGHLDSEPSPVWAENLWTAALEADLSIGRDQVARLMEILGIEGVRRGKHKTVTTTSDPKAVRHPDLIKRNWGAPTRPDQWGCADFTYVWTLAGFVYVSFVTDVFSRRILGWRVSTSKTTSLVLSALEQALFTRRRHNSAFTSTGLVHHSDAGSQYTSITFGEALIQAGISPSIGTVGDALDNALQESTIGLYKTELIDHERTRAWRGAAEVERETASYVHWFNQTRIHLSIGRMSPARYETLWSATQAAQDLSA
jgi:putative transposase